MALSKVQTSPYVRGAFTTLTSTFATPPTVGNAVIVPVVGWQAGSTVTAVTDNRGNTYVRLTHLATTRAWLSFWYCAKVTATGAPFTVSVTSTGHFNWNAIEVTGLGSGYLAVDQFKTNSSSGTAVSTGASAALRTANPFLVSLFSYDSSLASAVVESVSPAWTQEWEDLSWVNATGEVDTRASTLAAGAPASSAWTISGGGTWVSAVVAFCATTDLPAVGFARVQAVGGGGAGVASSTILFPTPPAVGSSLIVAFAESLNSAAVSCVDLHGNTYTLARESAAGGTRAGIFSGAVLVTGHPFQITLAMASGTTSWNTVAIEVGEAPLGLTVAGSAIGGGSTVTTTATGATGVLAPATVFVVAAISTQTGVNPVVETVTPAWFPEQEYPAVPGGGEIDSRLLTGVAGTTTSASWTHASTNTGAVVAAFAPAAPATPMPVFKAAGPQSALTGSTLIGWPTGHAIGDFGLLCIETCGGEPVPATPSGWTPVANSPQATGAGTAGTQLTVFYKVATSSAEPTVATGDAGDHNMGVIVTFTGVASTGLPWDVTAGGVKATAAANISLPTLTTTVGNTLVVQIATHDLDVGTPQYTGHTNAALVNLAERHDQSSAQGNGGGIGVWTGEKAAAGSIGTTTVNVAASVNAMLTIALVGAPLTPLRATQDVVEILSQPVLPATRVTQDVVEILGTTVLVSAPARVTQALVELLSPSEPPPAPLRVTQDVVELLQPVPPVPARLTQLALDVLAQVPHATALTQLAVEVATTHRIPSRLTQLAVELRRADPATLRMTQILVEIFLVPGPCVPTGSLPIDHPPAGGSCSAGLLP